jgi:hypothetical protein
MKKSILNIGKALEKAEQKSIAGGGSGSNCYSGPFLVDSFGFCFYRVNGVNFSYGTVVDNCCCGASF